MKSFIVILTALSLTACFPGPRGDAGLTGANGRDGNDGESCSVARNPENTGVLIICPSSNTLVMDGQDATPVSMVQLCPSVVGGYGNFPEMAFKVGNKLYGVMIGGQKVAIVRLYPGAYETTTPQGQNCHFVVAADGYTIAL